MTMTVLQPRPVQSRPVQTGDLLCPRSSPIAPHLYAPQPRRQLRFLTRHLPSIPVFPSGPDTPPLCVPHTTRPIILMVYLLFVSLRPHPVRTPLFPLPCPIPLSAPHNLNSHPLQLVLVVPDPAKFLVGPRSRPSAHEPLERLPKRARPQIQGGQDQEACQ